jgi:hypothetical protein
MVEKDRAKLLSARRRIRTMPCAECCGAMIDKAVTSTLLPGTSGARRREIQAQPGAT